MPKDGRFWRNIVLIALAHIALIAGLIRWSLAARASNPDSIVWLGAAGEPETEASPPAERVTPLVSPKPQNDDKTEEEKLMVTTAKSEIELPPPTPKPTATATPRPKPTATAAPKPKATPKPIPKPTPKKILLTKASSKPSPKEKSNSTKSDEKSVKNEKNPTAKTSSASQKGSGKTDSTGKGGSAGGDRKSTRLNSSHSQISYAVFCLKKKNWAHQTLTFELRASDTIKIRMLSLPEILNSGGLVLSLILLLSAVAVLVFIERFLHCHRA